MHPPPGDGFAVLEAARRRHPRLAIILISDNPGVPEAVRAMQLGADSYVARGAAGELRRAVRTVADRLRSRQGPVLRGQPPVPGATFAEIERHAIMATYEACGRSPRRTAEVLGLSPRTVHYRLREYRSETGRRLRSFVTRAGSTPD